MTPYRKHAGAPRPDQLTAYADGELDAATRADVEAWLADHPDAAAEVDAQRRLTRLVQAARPGEPDEASWATALAGIEAALAAPVSRALAGAKRSGWAVLAVRLTSAAAVFLLLLVPERAPRQPAVGPPVEPLPVASPDDVDIISVHGEDVGLLVVGDPPLREPLALAAAGEICVVQVQPDVDGIMPQVLPEGQSPAAPMVVAPLGAER
jgi:hypothetical protein